jgi:ribonucleoside-diphosphate reductase alpha chain
MTALQIQRRFTTAEGGPFAGIKFVTRQSRIANPDGTAVFEMNDVEVPEFWDQVSTDILASKYFRKAGVPQIDADGNVTLGSERSIKQVAMRLADAWMIWGQRGGYFASIDDAIAYRDEMAYMVVAQFAAPNSPQWFNTGLNEAYGLVEDPEGNWYFDPALGRAVESAHKYERSAANACFITSIDDTLVGANSIMRHIEDSARLFKAGSGVGANYSKIREKGGALTSGGGSSGLMSFLRVHDRAAGAIKSGGTTRRAAKMVIIDADHPDIEEFIWCKVLEERKVAALVAAGYSSDYNGEAYDTVSFQNANNSVRLPAGFLDAVEADSEWELKARRTGDVVKTIRARELWDKIAAAAWSCADPGLQFDDLINDWNTVADSDRINGSNPCSEFLFVDDSACNLASLNLVRFWDDETSTFDAESFLAAVRLWSLTLEITVTMSHYPTARIAENSYKYRPLGLGYANMGALLMRAGLPYDSDHARAAVGAITALLHSRAYTTSAEIAAAIGACEGYAPNADSALRVLRNHRRAAYGSLARARGVGEYEQLAVAPVGIDHLVLAHTPFAALSGVVTEEADAMLQAATANGIRNMQATVLAPTGCLTGDTLISTNKGLLPLSLLGDVDGAKWQEPSISDLRVLTDDGEQDVTKFFVNGLADVVRVTTSQGRNITGTPEHRIKVVSQETGEWEWRRFGDVRPGDVVPIATGFAGAPVQQLLPPADDMYWNGKDNLLHTPTHMNADLAELIGYFQGDGSLHAKGLRLCVAAQDDDVVQRLVDLSLQQFGILPLLSQGEGYIEVGINSVRLAAWWRDCGFGKGLPHADHSGKGHVPVVPNAVLATNDPVVYAAFLRGLFEADGTVTQSVALSSSNRKFITSIQVMFTALGILTGFGETVGGFSSAPVYKAVLRSGRYLEDFVVNIGFISGRKQGVVKGLVGLTTKKDLVPIPRDILDEVAPAGHWTNPTPADLSDARKTIMVAQSRRQSIMVSRGAAEALLEASGDARIAKLLEFFYDEVTDARLDGQEMTYDISVPHNVTYVANGFISHNTIGLLMGCDTTGVEPDFALVKMKKLAGGGYMQIVNGSVESALRTLGYNAAQITRIGEWLLGTKSLKNETALNELTLAAAGFTEGEIAAIAGALTGVADVTWAFGSYTIGEEAYARFGVDPLAGGAALLAAAGFSSDAVVAASKVICGHLTVEGAPDLRPEHLAVFDCAVECGDGTRVIHWSGHVKALAAAQPHISGAISKTINMPNDVTPDEVAEAHELSYRLGVKCVAIYRDGSKMSQPLNSAQSSNEEATAAVVREIVAGMSPAEFYNGDTPPRFKLLDVRYGPTWRFEVGGEEIYLRAGEYPDGTLGEVFIDWGKQGSTMRGITSALSICISQALQHGVPFQRIVKSLRGHTFEPRGMVQGNANVKMATSVIDAIIRVLGYHYLDDEDLVQVKGHVMRPSQSGVMNVDVIAPAAPTLESKKALDKPAENLYGVTCSACGGGHMIKAGSCSVCGDCGQTTGCS